MQKDPHLLSFLIWHLDAVSRKPRMSYPRLPGQVPFLPRGPSHMPLPGFTTDKSRTLAPADLKEEELSAHDIRSCHWEVPSQEI